jgi:hypothetical protein
MNEASRTQRAREVDARKGVLWLPLLQRLTALFPSALVWKNASSALQGQGDLDMVALPSEWKGLEIEFRRWARAEGLHPVAVCRHVPGSIFLLAVDPERPAFWELDIKARGTFRGLTVFRAGDLQVLSEMDPRGFRRLRPGAEGLLKFMLNCTTRDGDLNNDRLQRERVAELLREDPGGVTQAAQLFGSAGEQVLELVADFLRGEWNRNRMLVLGARLRRGLCLEPLTLMRRLWLRVGRKPACRGIKTLIKEEHLVPGDARGLRQIVQTHPIGDGVLSA